MANKISKVRVLGQMVVSFGEQLFLEVFVGNDCKGCVAVVTACTHHRANDTYVSEMPTRTVYTVAKNLERHLKSIFLDF